MSEVHVCDVPEYHRYEYGAVPPDGFAVKEVYCPASTSVFDAVGADATRVETTANVTSVVGVYAVSGVVAESVSFTQ